MATSNFNLNGMTNGLNVIMPYTPASREEFLEYNDPEGLTSEELDDMYEDYVENYYQDETSVEDAMSNIKFALEAKGYTLDESDDKTKVYLGNVPVARYEVMSGYYEGAQIDIELLKDKDFIVDLYNTGEFDFEDYITGVAEELNIYIKDDEDLYTPRDFEELEDIVDTETYEKFIAKVYSDVAKDLEKEGNVVLKTIQEYTTQLAYDGSFSNGEAMFSVISD